MWNSSVGPFLVGSITRKRRKSSLLSLETKKKITATRRDVMALSSAPSDEGLIRKESCKGKINAGKKNQIKNTLLGIG